MREHVSVIDIEHRWSCKIIIDSSMKICISEDESIAIYMKKCFYGLGRVCRLQSVAHLDTFSPLMISPQSKHLCNQFGERIVRVSRVCRR